MSTSIPFCRTGHSSRQYSDLTNKQARGAKVNLPYGSRLDTLPRTQGDSYDAADLTEANTITSASHPLANTSPALVLVKLASTP